MAARAAGPNVPAGRIFGSGTCLDSSRLQSLLAQKLDIDAQSVSGYVVGEHGDSSVALWSSVRVMGLKYESTCPCRKLTATNMFGCFCHVLCVNDNDPLVGCRYESVVCPC